MCGIVGAVAQRDVEAILLEGLRRLEYRGYDSAGLAVLTPELGLQRVRVQGKVSALLDSLQEQSLAGATGIAHTRWATHGRPSVENAHPHVCREQVALVHNGIIENHAALKAAQQAAGYQFHSETDTEVIVNQIHHFLGQGSDLLQAVLKTVALLEGAYALGVICASEPGRMIGARAGNPLVIGVGIGEYFLASDIFALLPVTQEFIVLEEGDVADIRRDKVQIFDRLGQPVARPRSSSRLSDEAGDKAGYRHYMLKEIFTQPLAIADTLEGRIRDKRIISDAIDPGLARHLERAAHIHIVACGTSYHAGLIARYWLEGLSRIPCTVEVASEYRYRRVVVPENTLLISISQSGETADTLAALQVAAGAGYLATLALCNVPESSLTRDADLVFLIRAGIEIGVASTKAFSTQLVALLMLAILLGRRRGLEAAHEAQLVAELQQLPGRLNQILELNEPIQALAERFVHKQHALYLGRGTMLPVAMEGALKLKEISYIHAEAYPAGELKHGPLALIDEDMPVIAVAPNNALLEKLRSNLHVVTARGGQVFVFADSRVDLGQAGALCSIPVAAADEYAAPIIYTVPLQLFAYHVAVLKGADVDQPRNLAKSVTVE